MSSQIDPLILRKLDAFSRRRRRLIVIRGLCAALATLLLTMMAVAMVDAVLVLPDGLRWGLSLAAYAAVLFVEWRSCLRLLMHAPDARRMARLVEHAEPKLREDLLSAVELGSETGDSAFDSAEFRGLLQSDVAHRMEGMEMEALLPMQLVRRSTWLAAGIALACLVVFALSGWQFGTLLLRALLPGANLARVSRVQVRVVEPEAPDKVVAQGETEPLVVEISGQRVNAARLETSTLSGRDVLKMTPVGPDRFSATIQVGREDVTYRIYAGDAVTKKFRLQAVARPHVAAFEKTYTYPAYSRLPARTVTEENGDLAGLEGSTVQLRLETNQKIKEAELRLEQGKKSEVIKLVQDGTRLAASVPLTSSGVYRVHLVGAETGFENKFSPEYELRADPDLAPEVTLDAPLQDLLLPANESVDLEGSASDDLALAKVAQLVKVNDGPWKETVLAQNPGAKYRIAQRWDLFAYGAKADDLLTTKLIAIDLKGNRRESRPLQVTITKSGFELKRLSALEAERQLLEALQVLQTAATDLAKKAGGVRDRMDRLPDGDAQRSGPITAANAALDEFAPSLEAAMAQLMTTLKGSEPGHVAADLVQIGRLLGKTNATGAQLARNTLAQAGSAPQAGYARDLVHDFVDLCNKLEQRVRLAEDSYRVFLAAEETEVISENLNVVAREQERLAALAQNTGADEAQKWAQLANRMRIVLGETRSLEELMDAATAHGRHDRWKSPRKQLEQAREGFAKAQRPGSRPDALREPMQNLARIGSAMARTAHEFSREQMPGAVHRQVDLRSNVGPAAAEILKLGDDLRQIATRTALPEAAREQLAEGRWVSRAQTLKQQGDVEEARPDGDSYYVNDVRTVSLAYEALHQGAPATGREKTQTGLLALEKQFRLLETAHDLAEVLGGLGHLAASERWEISAARALTSNPRDWQWLEERLRVATEEVGKLQVEEAWRAPAQQAHRLLTDLLKLPAMHEIGQEMRDRFVPDRAPRSLVQDLEPVQGTIKTALDLLRQPLDEARRLLAQMAPKLSEQMAQLAQKTEELEKKTAEQAEKAVEKAPEEAKAEAKAVLAEQAKINEQVQAVRDALRADANRQDILQAEGRERARDADDALALLKEPPPEAEEALNAAVKSTAAPERTEALQQAAKAQQQLASSLQQLAEHYAQVEQGKPEETRVALRATEEKTGVKEALDQQFAEAKQLAELAAKSPEEMLRQLEKELPVQPLMQRELSTIARDALDHAEAKLASASTQENQVAQQIAKPEGQSPDQRAVGAAQAAAEAAKAAAQAAQKAQTEAREAGQQAAQAANPPASQQSNQTAGDAARAEQMAQQTAQLAEQSARENQAQPSIQHAQQAAQIAAEAAKSAQQAAIEARQAKTSADEAAQKGGDKQGANQASSQHAAQAAEAADAAARAAQDAHHLARQAAQMQAAAAAAKAAQQAVQAAQSAQQAAENAEQQAQKAGNQPAAQQASQGAAQAARARAAAQQALDAAGQSARAATPQEAQQAAQQSARQAGEAAQAAQQAANELRQAQGSAQRGAQAGGEKLAMNQQSAQQSGQSSQDAVHAEQAAQNAQRLAQQAAEAAAAMAAESGATPPGAQERASAAQLARAARQQPPIAQAAATAGEEVSRAGRHEERLQNSATGQKLTALGEAVRQTAEQRVPQAQSALSEAKDATQAAPAVNAANTDLHAELGQLQAALGAAMPAAGQEAAAAAKPADPAAAQASPASPAAPATGAAPTSAAPASASAQAANMAQAAPAAPAAAPGAGQLAAATNAPQPTAATAAAAVPPATPQEQMWKARTLDALDAALHGQPPGMAQNEQGPETGQGAKPAGQNPAGQPSPAGQPAGQGNQPGQAAMAQAQQAMNSAAQAAAAAMRASRSQSPTENPGGPLAQGDQQAVSKGGAQAQAAGKAYAALADAKGRAGDWGKLPKQVAEQLTRGKNENVAGEYRNQVETYYRVIAEKAKKP